MRPPPSRLRWKPGSSRAPGGMLPSLGGGPRGEGRGRLEAGVCVFRAAESKKGAEAAVSAATSARAKQLSNFACAAPLPRAPGGTGAAQRLGVLALVGDGPGCGRVKGSLAGDAEMAPLPRGGTGGAPPRDPVWETTRGPSAAHPPAAPCGPHQPAGREAGAEGGGGALETAPRGYFRSGPEEAYP